LAELALRREKTGLEDRRFQGEEVVGVEDFHRASGEEGMLYLLAVVVGLGEEEEVEAEAGELVDLIKRLTDELEHRHTKLVALSIGFQCIR
jgi:hypothetical protein